MQIFEYDLVEKAYTDWSRRFNASLHEGWASKNNKTVQIMYNETNHRQLYLRDEALFCIIDQSQV